MIVLCIRDNICNPPKSLIENGWTNTQDYLTIGKCYKVYAICHQKNYDWFLICDDNYDGVSYNYPIYIPDLFFSIIDNSKPNYWIKDNEYPEYEGPKELSPRYYELLVDGNQESLTKFKGLLDV